MIENKMYIIVDDDPLNNMVSKMLLKTTLGDVEVRTFSDPEEGLLFIKNEFNGTSKTAVLFLDINMPTLTGWEFLEQYETFSQMIRRQISVYILSSSVGQSDQQKAMDNKQVVGFISKPLTLENIMDCN